MLLFSPSRGIAAQEGGAKKLQALVATGVQGCARIISSLLQFVCELILTYLLFMLIDDLIQK